MEVIEHIIRLTSHCFFIGLIFHYLTSLFDWSKVLHKTYDNATQLRLFLILVSIGLGFLVSEFVLTILTMSRDFFVAFS